MQVVKEKPSPDSGRFKPGCINKKKTDRRYRAIAAVIIQWEYAKRQNKHSLILLFNSLQFESRRRLYM
jgi:hypothetical protein